MTKTMAERRAEQLRKKTIDDAISYEVKPRREGSKTYFIEQLRNDHPTGARFYI